MSTDLPPPAPVDLDNCAREPIHIPGAIQPHGVLLVVREPSLDLAATSASLTAHLGVAVEAAVGRPVVELLDAPSGQRLRDALASITPGASLRTVNPLHVQSRDGRLFEAVLHRPPAPAGVLVIELEPVSAAYGVGGPTFDPRLRSAIVRLQGATDAVTLTRIAAEEVRTLTGFDRVMIYEFDDDWNGAVVAESRRDDLDSFLGQHYPASDIPAQARRLYELNWLRLIADARYVPSPLLGLPSSEGPLDMSSAVLRSGR